MKPFQKQPKIFVQPASGPVLADISLPRPPAPHPRAVPLGPFGTLRTLRKNPIETWTKLHFEKPLLVGHSVLGLTAIVSEPAAIRRVLSENAANYRKDDLQRRILSPGLGDGLLTVEGEAWKMQRRTLAPLFTPKMVTSFTQMMIDAAETLLARWRRQREGRILDVQVEMGRATLDVLGRTIFSDGLGRNPQDFMAVLSDYFKTIGQLDPVDLFNLPDFVPRINNLRSKGALRFFKESVETIIDQRRERLERLEREPDAVPRDILTLLLEAADPETHHHLTQEEVYANILTFIGAGHETTANALTWSLYLLSLSPHWRERVASEADSAFDGPLETLPERLTQTRAVIEEAMRLYPPVSNLSRQAIDADDLCGQRIRKGCLVMISPWVLHRHKLLWEHPDHFDPSRFLPGAREKIDRFAYLPFGAGPRICIGAFFALHEATIVLASVLRHFRLEHVDTHDVMPVQRITLRPENGMPMVLYHRKVAA
jgi:cytochrome P450